jgi:hypothetical protein
MVQVSRFGSLLIATDRRLRVVAVATHLHGELHVADDGARRRRAAERSRRRHRRGRALVLQSQA